MKSEFDYQWKNLLSKNIEYGYNRISEFKDFTGISHLKDANVLDAGCGNGRYTYAMQKMGANVDSIDISAEAIKQCKKINPKASIMSVCDIMGQYDFILCYGVLHHTRHPRFGFLNLSKCLVPGGMLHVMLYSNEMNIYGKLRKQFKALDQNGRVKLCEQLSLSGGDIHGWFDALNPEFNFSYDRDEIVRWFKDEGFSNIQVMPKKNIHINGTLE